MKILLFAAAVLAGVHCHSSASAQGGDAWPGGFAGHLEPAELVWGIVSSGQPLHRGLAVDFKLTLIEEGQMLVEEDAMQGLPYDETGEERRANRSSAEIEMPYNLSEAAQRDPAGFEAFVDSIASRLERFRAVGEPGLAAEATCSGLRPGAEWTARATDARCEHTRVLTYRCTVTETDGQSRGIWLRTASREESGAGDLASHCG
ncbi:hypothetical protein [Wenzhouxiangella sediminis]|uniref:Uncharacterized protein n=1 Tax=Wenzhouxiangella sediminis TaxID=1792836 RepID=A0A3E1K906_9GAMM|nr:hypothetical protein [Wenzhouxiangella sediminis]RFF30205.1 hypothetical protein DZC52_08995 [Wenzhouxiangella sediminis]